MHPLPLFELSQSIGAGQAVCRSAETSSARFNFCIIVSFIKAARWPVKYMQVYRPGRVHCNVDGVLLLFTSTCYDER